MVSLELGSDATNWSDELVAPAPNTMASGSDEW